VLRNGANALIAIPMDAKPITKARVIIEEAPNKIFLAPSGVFGSNNFQGKINAEFFVEKKAYPESFMLSINPNNNTATESHPNEELVMVREVQATIQFDPQLAEAVGNWLIAQAATLRAQMSGQKPISITGIASSQPK
jgi:hypothetical protein